MAKSGAQRKKEWRERKKKREALEHNEREILQEIPVADFTETSSVAPRISKFLIASASQDAELGRKVLLQLSQKTQKAEAIVESECLRCHVKNSSVLLYPCCHKSVCNTCAVEFVGEIQTMNPCWAGGSCPKCNASITAAFKIFPC